MPTKQPYTNAYKTASHTNPCLDTRPNASTGKLEKADEQDWAKDLAFQSHRLKDSWRLERYKWLNEEGIPSKPDYRRCKRAAEQADFEEAEYCAGEEVFVEVGGKRHLQHHCDLTDIAEGFEGDQDQEQQKELGQAAFLQWSPQKRRNFMQVDENLGSTPDKREYRKR